MSAQVFKRGIYSTISGLTGTFYYTGLTKSKSAEQDSIADVVGNTSGAVEFNVKETAKLTANFAPGATIPAIGDTFTVDGTTYGITSVSEAQNNKSAATVDMEGEYFLANAFAPTMVTTSTTT